MVFTVKTSQGVYDLEASARFIGRDPLVAVWGGERPHVGAVAIAQPRPSLKDPERVSATASVVCLLGHKEDDLAKAVVEILAAAMNTTVVAAAGIRWDNLDAEGINQILRNSEILVDLILEKIGRLSAHT